MCFKMGEEFVLECFYISFSMETGIWSSAPIASKWGKDFFQSEVILLPHVISTSTDLWWALSVTNSKVMKQWFVKMFNYIFHQISLQMLPDFHIVRICLKGVAAFVSLFVNMRLQSSLLYPMFKYIYMCEGKTIFC